MLKPLPFNTYESSSNFSLPPNSVLFHGFFEERSRIPASWTKDGSVTCVEIQEANDISHFFLKTDLSKPIYGNNLSELKTILNSMAGRVLYIDLTGLSHHVWMPLLKCSIEERFDVNCIYVEPEKYKLTNTPRPGEFHDLSESIRGIFPIPSFARLSANRGAEILVVPLLGFEGTRFKFMMETLQPEGNNIYPFIGVPGFQLEYPFHTYEGNANTLIETRAWENVRYVDAACPFSVAIELSKLQENRKSVFLQVPLVGTKPHALGAAIYAIRNNNIELVYDHPIRKQARTSGSARCHVYSVSEFCRSVK